MLWVVPRKAVNFASWESSYFSRQSQEKHWDFRETKLTSFPKDQVICFIAQQKHLVDARAMAAAVGQN